MRHGACLSVGYHRLMEPSDSRSQLNVRISPHGAKLIDNKRIELSKHGATIPSRSDVLRFALAAYLGVDVSELGVDGRQSARR